MVVWVAVSVPEHPENVSQEVVMSGVTVEVMVPEVDTGMIVTQLDHVTVELVQLSLDELDVELEDSD